MNFLARVLISVLFLPLARAVERLLGFWGVATLCAVVFAAPWLLRIARVVLL